MSSLVTDLGKHQDTRTMLRPLMPLFVAEIQLDGARGARRFIEGLPRPRHWGRGYYDFTIMPPTCLGWSGGDMQRLRRTIKQARKSIAEHVARCERCKGTTFPVRRGMLARLRGLR
jgi:hypothetical protein